MLKHLVVAALVLVTFVILPVYGQKSTEVFIPIGKSPGVSGKYSVIGKIRSIDSATRILTISGEDGEHSARITEETKIWLDKSEMKVTSKPGSPADCREGRWCEIKYASDDPTRTGVAEWIKIRVGDSD